MPFTSQPPTGTQVTLSQHSPGIFSTTALVPGKQKVGRQVTTISCTHVVKSVIEHWLKQLNEETELHKHSQISIQYYRSHCHGNVYIYINDDSKSHRSIPIAWRMILNPVDVCCGQSVSDNIIGIIITSVPDSVYCQSVGMRLAALVSHFESLIVKFQPIWVHCI